MADTNGAQAPQPLTEFTAPMGQAVDAEEERGKLGIPPIEQIGRSIWANKLSIIAITSACVVIGLIVTFLATPLYTTAALIEISRQQANVSGVEAVEEDDRSRDQEFYDTQYSLLKARSLAQRVVRDQNLVVDDAFFEAFNQGESEGQLAGAGAAGSLSAAARVKRLETATTILLENVSIEPVRGSSLVNIAFTSPQPELSAKISNAWAEQFIEANLSRRFSSTEDARTFLEKQLEELRQKLEDSESQLINYASAKGIIALSTNTDAEGRTVDGQTLVTADLEAMNAELAVARSARIAAESAYRQAGQSRASPNNSTISGLRQRRAVVAAERAKLLATFKPEYPTVEALTAELAALDGSIASEIANESNRINSSASSAFREAQQREQQIASRVEALKSQFGGENQASIQYNIYQREVDTNRELYNGLLQRYKEIGVAGVGPNNVLIVDSAQVPRFPSSPNLPLNIALALLTGIALSAAYLFAREQIDQTLRNPADVSKLLGLSQLGAIPVFDEENIIEALTDAKSMASEAYFSFSTNVSFLTEQGTPKTMMFTSTQPSEGKSTSSVGLSQMLARKGKPVLLIDADMRSPSIHGIFKQELGKGLSNFLSGDDDLKSLIEPSEIPQLFVMSAGPMPPNPAELLSGDRIKELIALLSKDFAHVIFDAPPVLGLADVPLLSKNVDGVLYAVEANNAKLRTIQSSLQRLKDCRANVYGAIVTKIDQRNSAYGYGDNYGYGYNYGHKSEQSA